MDCRQSTRWRLLTAGTVAFAWFVVFAAFVHPPHGTGIPLCLWHSVSSVRCPGCGLSRSISSLAHGHWADSLRYHPFGFAVFALCAAVAAMSVLRRPSRDKAEPRAFRVGFIWFAAAFILIGAARTVWDILRLPAP